jgi:hypothetical protein
VGPEYHGWTAPYIDFFLPWRNSPSGPEPPNYRGFMITLRRTTLGRTPLDEWSARRRDLYLTTYSTHKRNIRAPSGIRTHALDCAATGIGLLRFLTLTKWGLLLVCISSPTCEDSLLHLYYLPPNVAKWNRRKFSRRCRVSNQHLYLFSYEVCWRRYFW